MGNCSCMRLNLRKRPDLLQGCVKNLTKKPSLHTVNEHFFVKFLTQDCSNRGVIAQGVNGCLMRYISHGNF
jgi:hypothetical protein